MTDPEIQSAWRIAINAHIGEQIRTYRRARKWSQTELAKQVGLTFQQVQKYEHGSNRLSASRMFEFARVFDVHPMTFVAGFESGWGDAPAVSPVVVHYLRRVRDEVSEALREIGDE
jgi:transcriptional regulator with XRE-family HTH domain